MCKVTCDLIVGVGEATASDLYKGGPITTASLTSFVHCCTGILTPEQGSSANICWKKLSEFPSLPVCTVPSSLTSTDAPGHSHIVAVITLQPFVVVARPHGAAVLVQLRSAHLAAPTSIWHCANTWRANQRLFGALTHCWTASSHLKGAEREIVF